MKVSYEYQGHTCPFKARVWDDEREPRLIETCVAIVGDGFVTVDYDGESFTWSKCEPIPEPKVIPWTPETAPFPLALRGKGWAKGAYILCEVSADSAFSCSTNGDGRPNYCVSWEDLASPNSFWETRDGNPCGEVVS